MEANQPLGGWEPDVAQGCLLMALSPLLVGAHQPDSPLAAGGVESVAVVGNVGTR